MKKEGNKGDLVPKQQMIGLGQTHTARTSEKKNIKVQISYVSGKRNGLSTGEAIKLSSRAEISEGL